VKITLDGLPVDSSNTRRAKMFLMAYHVYGNQGITHTQLLKFGRKRFSNVPEKIEEYIAEILYQDLISKDGYKYYVTDANLREFGEAHGFVEVPKPVICSDCGHDYNTNHSKCPVCKSLNREGTNDVSTPLSRPHIYTQNSPEMLSIEKHQVEPAPMTVPPEKSGHQPIYIHEKIGFDRLRKGKEAELRVVELLNQFGEARLDKGNYGRPDVLWAAQNDLYGVEVKTVGHATKCKAFKLSKKKWLALCDYCEQTDLKPILVVEERINGSKYGHVYHWIQKQMVDAKLASSDADRVSFGIYELSSLHSQAITPGKPFMLRMVF